MLTDAERIVTAREAAANYKGSYPFMLDQKRRATNASWTPTSKQAIAILRCVAHDAKASR